MVRVSAATQLRDLLREGIYKHSHTDDSGMFIY